MKIAFIGEGAMTPDIMFEQVKSIGDFEAKQILLPYSIEELAKVEKVGTENMPIPDAFNNLKDVDIAVCHFSSFGSKVFDLMPKLKILATLRAGTENIDKQEATKRGIATIHCPGRNAEAVSDQAISLMLSEVYNIARGHADLMNGIWNNVYPTSSFTPILAGKRAGIFGFGNIGKLTAKKLKGFDIEISVYDPYLSEEEAMKEKVKKVEKETLFSESDFIFVHARLDEGTHHAIGEKEFSLMKPKSWIFNNARAGLIDTEALLKTLQNHKIAGAGIDVFDIEPLPADSPFLKLDNATLTPHNGGGSSEEIRVYAAKMVTNGILSILDEKPNFQVMNPEVLLSDEFKNWIVIANKELGRK